MSSNTYDGYSDSFSDMESGSEFVPSSSEEELESDVKTSDCSLPPSPRRKKGKVGNAHDKKRGSKQIRLINKGSLSSSRGDSESIDNLISPTRPIAQHSTSTPSQTSHTANHRDERPLLQECQLSTPVSGSSQRRRLHRLGRVRGMEYDQKSRNSQHLAALDIRLKKVEKNQLSVMQQLKRIEALLESREPNRDRKMSKSKQLEVPAHIKSAVHDGYRCGRDDKQLNWRTKDDNNKTLKYNSQANQEMTDQIMAFVKGFYPSAELGIISAAVERYFESMKQKEYKKNTGKESEHKKKMMLYSRKKRKLTWRKDALTKKKRYDDEKKKKIVKALVLDFISSEEEGESDNENVFIVKPLEWRSDELNKIFEELDEKNYKTQTARSKKQMVKRVRGMVPSNRPKPEQLAEELEWAVKRPQQENENIELNEMS